MAGYKYKYSGFKTKACPRGDFRMEKPKLGTATGGWRWTQGCDQFIAGRWEGFAASRSPVFKTKAEALKHRPKW